MGLTKKKINIFLFAVYSLSLITSCKNNHCTEPMYAPMVVSFYSGQDTTKQVSPPYLTIQGMGSDSLINASGSNNANLPLKQAAGSSQFLFTIADGNSPVDGDPVLIQDTLTVIHTNTLDFVSAECGCLTTYHIEDAQFEQNKIGTISIINRSVTSNYNERHINIYLQNY